MPWFPSSNDTHTQMEVNPYTPMEIDNTRFQPLLDAQRQHQRDNGLCVYCGTPGHVIHHCSVRGPRHQPHRARLAEVSQQQENAKSGCSRSHAAGRFPLPNFSVLLQPSFAIRRFCFASKSLFRVYFNTIPCLARFRCIYLLYRYLVHWST